MNKEAVRHTGTYPDLYLKDRSTMVLTLRIARQQAVSCRIVYFSRTAPQEKKQAEMFCAFRDRLFDYYRAEVSPDRVARYQKYYFEISEKDAKWYYSTYGIRSDPPGRGCFEFLYANSTGIAEVPEWSRGAVYYQIFPERFCRGEPCDDAMNYEEWGTLPTKENYMGGNLKGILDRLDYLEWLGVECIYLNPIFSADFNHKYATRDYFEIDRMFGNAEIFRQLVEELHRRKMRIILDGVFNHTGIHFPQFQDILKRQEESAWTDWYHIRKYPVTVSEDCYECVGDYKYMPKLNTGNPQVREFVLGVMEYWIREFHIDGWRLDVADEVDESVWLEARIRLKEKYPQSLLLGETWGSGFRLMNGLEMDCIMNYTFRDAVCDFFAQEAIDAEEFDGRLQQMLAGYPEPMNQAMFLPLDSHDTERFLYCCGGNIERLKLAVIFQMTFVGAPSVYYGDEVGLTGANDPDCRRCMVWDHAKQDRELLQLYRELILLRRRKQCIKTGRYTVNLCEGRLYGFARFDEKQEVYTILNADDRPRMAEVPVFYKKKHIDWRSGREYLADPAGDRTYLNSDIRDYGGRIRIRMEPMSAVILLSKEE